MSMLNNSDTITATTGTNAGGNNVIATTEG